MFRCIQCKEVFSEPELKKDRFDGEIYKICPRCKVTAQEPEERCRCCGRELFRGDSAFEINDELYCALCVNEVII